MTTKCKALTNWPDKEQCSRQAKVRIKGVGFCIPHAAKICLQQAVKDGTVEPIRPEDWFYKNVINKPVRIIK